MPLLRASMDAEPPADYVRFVVGSVGALRDETARLVGERDADRIYPEALSDLARHWHRLRAQQRRTADGPDPATAFLRRRLTARVAQFREDNDHPVEVYSVPPPGHPYAPVDRLFPDLPVEPRPVEGPPAAPADSVARRMAALLPTTTRAGSAQVAEAEIAWVHAYQRYCLVRVGRHIAGVALVVAAIVQVMTRLSGTGG